MSIFLSTASLLHPSRDTLIIPRDPHLLMALGKLAIAHTHLELILRYTHKTLTGLPVAAGLDNNRRWPTSRVRDEIKKQFNDKQPTADETHQLETLMSDAKDLTAIRNGFLHVAWSETADGKTVRRRTSTHRWELAPSPQQVEDVTNRIVILMSTLNQARKDGFIAEVVKRHRQHHPAAL